MDFDFKTKHLKNLYTKGYSKKYKLQPHMIKKYLERINRIESAKTINDLREPPSMEFKKLEGYDNRFSIRLNQQYRLEFEMNFEDKEKTYGSVLIVDVSNHYS